MFTEQFQINVFAFLIAVILLIIVTKRITIESFSRRLLQYIIIVTMIVVITEPLTWYFDGELFKGAYILEYATNMILVFLGPLLATLMILYTEYYIDGNRAKLRKRHYYMYPVIFTGLLLIVNFFYPVYFEVNKTTNLYNAGPFQWVNSATIILIYFYIIIVLSQNKEKLNTKKIFIFHLFYILPLLGMIIQSFCVGIFFSYNSIVLSIFVIFVFLESDNGERDHLSQLYNRKSYEKYVQQLIEKEDPFRILLLDINKFKAINDNFGHIEGDKTIIEFSNVLKDVCRPNKLVSRLGGDEFIVVLENSIPIKDLVDNMYKEMNLATFKILHTLSFSYGCHDYEKGLGVDKIYKLVDKKMYEYKNSNHKFDRRETDN